jgi:hypothetical protein
MDDRIEAIVESTEEMDWLRAVVSDGNGRIFDLPGYAAVGWRGSLARLRGADHQHAFRQ